MNWNKRLLSVALLSIVSIISFAQESKTNRVSPLAIISVQYKDAYVKVTYSQPQKRGREIFGKLVPYGQPWRTGSNEATEITLTKDLMVNGTLLKAGTYSIFTIPEKEKWTIIFNNDVGLWGAYNYNPKRDEMRFEVPTSSTSGEVYEYFTMQFDQRNEEVDLFMIWDRVKISVPIRFLN